MKVQVTIETEHGTLTYEGIVDTTTDGAEDQRRVRNVMGAAAVMGFSLLDAKYTSESYAKESDS